MKNRYHDRYYERLVRMACGRVSRTLLVLISAILLLAKGAERKGIKSPVPDADKGVAGAAVPEEILHSSGTIIPYIETRQLGSPITTGLENMNNLSLSVFGSRPAAFEVKLDSPRFSGFESKSVSPERVQFSDISHAGAEDSLLGNAGGKSALSREYAEDGQQSAQRAEPAEDGAKREGGLGPPFPANFRTGWDDDDGPAAWVRNHHHHHHHHDDDDCQPPAVPEPGTVTLTLVGLASFALLRRRWK
ncbi:MAG: hypothetical protein QOG91_284 [Candidatus Parcubacteria bacterium]|nr:hypothetical protein [Candidatus Parcubacteria bacterium]